MRTVLSMPSDPADPRYRAPRSPDCPNDITREGDEILARALSDKAGLCGLCAWGFYSMYAEGHQAGEPIHGLTLIPVLTGEGYAGYKAQCGRVKLYRDQDGRIGAVKCVSGEERFFPGITGNWAFERYMREHPELSADEAA